MIREKIVKHYLVDTVRDSVSGSVNDLGEGGFSEWLSRDSRVGNWRSNGNVVVADDVGVSEGIDWMSNDAGISKTVDLVSKNVGVTDWLSDDAGVSEGGVWVSNDVGVSKGGWNDGRGDNGTLLPSRTSKSFLVSNGVGGSSLSNLWSFLWSNWGDQWSGNWASNWTDWKIVGSNLESTMSSGVSYSDFLSVGVYVRITTGNISGSITDGRMGLSGVSISV